LRARVKRIRLVLVLAWLFFAVAVSNLPSGWAAASSVTLNPSQDAYVRSDLPSNNYGSSTSLEVDASPEIRAYIKFDLSAIPEHSVIVSATLRLYASGFEGGYTTPPTVCVYRVTGSWDEATVTWDTQPSYDNTTSYGCIEVSSGWNEWDITDLVQAWVNGTYDNYGIAIINQYERKVSFSSREGSYPPELLVEYVEPVTTTVTITETVTETAYVTTVTDTVNTTVTDYVTETQTITTTVTDTVYTTETAYTTETSTVTQTITDVITETATTIITETHTEWANQTVTVTTTMTPTTTVTIWANETVTMTEYGNSTACQSVDYQALANALMPIVMVVGVICTMLGLILSATSSRRGG